MAKAESHGSPVSNAVHRPNSPSKRWRLSVLWIALSSSRLVDLLVAVLQRPQIRDVARDQQRIGALMVCSRQPYG